MTTPEPDRGIARVARRIRRGFLTTAEREALASVVEATQAALRAGLFAPPGEVAALAVLIDAMDVLRERLDHGVPTTPPVLP